MIEPCSASGPYSFIRVLVDGAILGSEVSHAVLGVITPNFAILQTKKENKVILCQNMQPHTLYL